MERNRVRNRILTSTLMHKHMNTHEHTHEHIYKQIWYTETREKKNKLVNQVFKSTYIATDMQTCSEKVVLADFTSYFCLYEYFFFIYT